MFQRRDADSRGNDSEDRGPVIVDIVNGSQGSHILVSVNGETGRIFLEEKHRPWIADLTAKLVNVRYR